MRAHVPALILVVVVAGGVFVNARRGVFLWDDDPIILNNPLIRSMGRALTSFAPRYWVRLRQLDRQQTGRQYRPVAEISFALDYALWGLNELGYHVTSILVHMANSVLVYFLAYRVLRRHKGAALCGLLFAAHPIHVEPDGHASRCTLAASCALASPLGLRHRRSCCRCSWDCICGASWTAPGCGERLPACCHTWALRRRSSRSTRCRL